jgi:P4 family phage/plasmid primase-like protien
MDEFRKQLRSFKCDKGQAYTHTSIDNPKISLCVPEDKVEEFKLLYKNAIVQKIPLHLTEKPTDPSPMRIDLDFRFSMVDPRPGKDDSLPRMYTTTHVQRILIAYFKILYSYLDIPDDPASTISQDIMTAYVMEKPAPVEYRGKIKDGIHVIWPHIVIPHSFQHLIRKQILVDAGEIFQGLSFTNTFDDIIDQAIIDKNNWQMYRSRKPECEEYTVTQIYSYVQGGINEGDTELISRDVPSLYDQLQLDYVSLFSMRKKEHQLIPFREDKKAEIDEYIRHVLPTMDDRRKHKLHSQIFGKSLNLLKNFITDDEFELARRLVHECLHQKRAESYEDWVKLGWTLRNIDFRLLDAWVEFSRVSSKYIEGECQKLWNQMRSDTMGIATLRWWAREDNPMKYKEICDASVIDLIDKSIGTDGAHFDVAKVVHGMYKDRYRFAMKDTWYVYNDNLHRWVRSREGLKLRNVLSVEVCQKFMERALYWNIESTRSGVDDEQRNTFQTRKDKLNIICVKLKNASYKNSIMQECKSLFTDEKFEEMLDHHVHLIGFENGVYDLRMHEFRDGLPDDYISFSTGRHYQKYDPKSSDAKEIETYLGQVFTNVNVKRYVKDIFACSLDGGIRQEKFYIFTGSGCHAKDTPIMLSDGNLKMVQDIQVGDILMGDDSTPRNVLELFRGNAKMYRISPVKGISFIVNEDHVLSLKFTNLTHHVKRSDSQCDRWRAKWYELSPDMKKSPTAKSKSFKSEKEAIEFKLHNLPEKAIKQGDILDITVKDLLQWNNWWHLKGNLNLYRPEIVHFEEKPLEIDPYMFGCWIGDGHSNGPAITTMDSEIVKYFEDNMPPEHIFKIRPGSAKSNGKARTYGISFTGKKQRYICDNYFTNALREYKVYTNKHIPDVYKFNSRENRLKLLAGILDTDGTYQAKMFQYCINQTSERIINDIEYLVRSLGFACYKKQIQAKCCNNGKIGTYYRLNISGNGIEEIPTLLPRKKAECRNKSKNVLLNSFKIEPVGDDNYYGFELDGNHRYLMGDFTVTHNSNSKSVLLNLLQKAIGDYYCILPVALLTQKRQASNSAQSELERTKGRRMSIMQEPGENEKLNIGLMKELSGGDRILCRGLFKEPIEFRPQFKMILTCNELPEVNSDDGGTWRRIRVIEYTSKFLDKPDPKNPKEFPIDPDLTDKLDRWADTFLSMLIEHHRDLDIKNMVEPAEVRIATEGYKKNNDVIGQFIGDKLEKDETVTTRVLLNKLFTDFRTWAFQVVQKGKKVPDRNQFRAYMEKDFGIYPGNGRGWKGIRVKNSGEGGGGGDDVDSDVD